MTEFETIAQVRVTDELISAERLARSIASARAGAIVTFEGVVRDHHGGKPVAFLAYEAYANMAEKILRQIASEAAKRWEIEAVAVHHRTGRLEIGEVSVAIAVASAHRGEAFEALRYVIDMLKERAPIWKRETGPDGSFWIEGPDCVRAGG